MMMNARELKQLTNQNKVSKAKTLMSDISEKLQAIAAGGGNRYRISLSYQDEIFNEDLEEIIVQPLGKLGFTVIIVNRPKDGYYIEINW